MPRKATQTRPEKRGARLEPLSWKRRRVVGKTQDRYKEWRATSNDGTVYAVVWRNEAYGVSILMKFRAFIVDNPGKDEKIIALWDWPPTIRKTLKAAQDECERHRRNR